MNNQKLIDAAIDLIDTYRPDVAAVLRKIPVSFGELDKRDSAEYRTETKEIVISTASSLDVDILATDLIHEGVHALDDANGNIITTGRFMDVIVKPETRAKFAEMEFWTSLYPNGKYPERTRSDQQANEWQRSYLNGRLKYDVAYSYADRQGLLTK